MSGTKGNNMPIIAQYDEQWAYLSQEDYDNLDEEDKEYREPEEYDEDLDSMHYYDFKYEVKEAFSKRKFPLVLAARKSNWRGQDGFARAENVQDVLNKIMNFDSGSVELHRGRGGSLEFKMGGTHDVPTGFTIEIKQFNQAYWEKL